MCQFPNLGLWLKASPVMPKVPLDLHWVPKIFIFFSLPPPCVQNCFSSCIAPVGLFPLSYLACCWLSKNEARPHPSCKPHSCNFRAYLLASHQAFVPCARGTFEHGQRSERFYQLAFPRVLSWHAGLCSVCFASLKCSCYVYFIFCFMHFFCYVLNNYIVCFASDHLWGFFSFLFILLPTVDL